MARIIAKIEMAKLNPEKITNGPASNQSSNKIPPTLVAKIIPILLVGGKSLSNYWTDKAGELC